MRKDRHTIRLIAAFRNFANAPKNITCRNSEMFTSAGDVLIPSLFKSVFLVGYLVWFDTICDSLLGHFCDVGR